MLDETDNPHDSAETPPVRRRGAGRPAGPPKAAPTTDFFAAPIAAPKRAPKAAKPKTDVVTTTDAPATVKDDASADEKPAKKTAAKKTAVKKTTAKKVAAEPSGLLFKAPDATVAPARKKSPPPAAEKTDPDNSGSNNSGSDDRDRDDDFDGDDDDAPRRRRRSRGGRRRRNPPQGGGTPTADGDESNDANFDDDGDNGPSQAGGATYDEDENGNPTLRRRRRRRAGEDAGVSPDDPENTTVRVREARSAEDEITGVSGSTRLEAKKQRRREGREAGRRRAPIVSEAEFLARRESVKREMAVRQHAEYTQIAVLEDNLLVEHYVARESQTSLIGNVYLGKVQNVLPSMEAAFVDIGKGRNAVLYAGEVDWTTLGNGKQRKIEDVLSSGQTVLVQVSKDPVGQKGARLTSQVSLAGRFLVYVPGGQTSGISRKLPDTERTRLKTLLKDVLPEDAGVIVRTAAEGATEDQLIRDVSALTARWEDIERKVQAGNSPGLLYAEPDLMIKVVRDLFNEDFSRLVVEGDDAWDMVSGYINHVAPDLIDRLERWNTGDKDVFDALRVEEQIAKALDRKVFLPSGGSLVIDRTEAMTVVDVNTGKFTGSGGNLEETVTKNNLEAAEEIVRQLRLRDIGGIIVIDFIDMVLEGNRDLVLRRLVECLGRDRTRHQVAEVTSLGLVQMTRKRIGTGLLESFSTDCDHCHGRGVVVQIEPVEPKHGDDSNQRRGNRRGGRNDKKSDGNGDGNGNARKSDKVAQGDSAPKGAPKGAPSDVPNGAPSDAPNGAPSDAPASKAKTNGRRSGKASRPADQSVAAVVVEAVPENAPMSVPLPDSVVETAPDVTTVPVESSESMASVTENAVKTTPTAGPVLTSEGQAP